MRNIFLRIFLVISLASPIIDALADDNFLIGDTHVAYWKDNKSAAFLLMFDDSWPSHWQVVAPELLKRGMIATFYINPGKGEYQKFSDEWENKLWRQGMVYGDHTMTHTGVKDMQNAEWEIGECARIIRQISPGKENRLVSYGQPGGTGNWHISQDQLDALLQEHHLINRPTFDKHGAVYFFKTTEDMLALADKAIAQKGMEYLIIHGVERIGPNVTYQDMWALKQDIFLPLLDGLKARSDKGNLWITDHISEHQYQTERDNAEVRKLSVDQNLIRLELAAHVDANLYDYPLTLMTNVPASWSTALVTQGDILKVSPVKNGIIQFDAIPNAGLINIREAQ
ncbi:polysaccharide deacetylase family protein [Methyloradius palustris]|uniref:NodB homology domain-containing protein n=1 Tax=Methyloradius palustris TaxID=2778876 RepID=A0A8D5FYU4_9PROT|nr:polysaccharide deacetylase family protein [Methyloradius palustris]BCM24245.1 hypothetical protein ZMTM_05040 [Methyloradius palustris]